MNIETRRVPRPRGDIDAATIRRLRRLQANADAAQGEFEQAVVDAHLAGASLRALHQETGIAQTTVLRWLRARNQ